MFEIINKKKLQEIVSGLCEDVRELKSELRLAKSDIFSLRFTVSQLKEGKKMNDIKAERHKGGKIVTDHEIEEILQDLFEYVYDRSGKILKNQRPIEDLRDGIERMKIEINFLRGRLKDCEKWESIEIQRRFENKIGNRIAQLQLQKGMTLLNLSNNTYMNPYEIMAMQMGHKDVLADDVKKFADAFGVSVDELLGIEEKS